MKLKYTSVYDEIIGVSWPEEALDWILQYYNEPQLQQTQVPKEYSVWEANFVLYYFKRVF